MNLLVQLLHLQATYGSPTSADQLLGKSKCTSIHVGRGALTRAINHHTSLSFVHCKSSLAQQQTDFASFYQFSTSSRFTRLVARKRKGSGEGKKKKPSRLVIANARISFNFKQSIATPSTSKGCVSYRDDRTRGLIHAVPMMTPPAEPETSPSDLAAGRQIFLAANETSRAFIGGPRPSWMTSAVTTVRPASNARVEKSKPGHDKVRKKIFAPSACIAAVLPHQILENQGALVAEAVAPCQKPSSNEPDFVRFVQQALAGSKGSHPPTKIMHGIQPEQQTDNTTSTHSRAAPFPPHEQPNIGVDESTASSTAASLESHNSLSRAQPNTPVAHATAHTLSTSPGVRAVASFSSSRRQTRPTRHATPPNFDFWRQTIVTRVTELEKHNEHIGSLERWRYTKLLEACEHGDMAFLIFHRILCQWSKDQQHPPEMRAVNPNLDAALNLLQQYFRPASEMRSQHLAWFIQFPWDPSCPSRPFAFCNTQAQAIFTFLDSFSQRWNNALGSVVQRQFPLLVNELVHMIGCPSVVLRVVLFSVSWRVLGVRDGPVATEMAAIHEIDIRNEILAATSSPDPQNSVWKRRAIASKYQGVLMTAAAQLRRLHVNEPSSPSMLTPVSTPVGQQRNDIMISSSDTTSLADVASTAYHAASNSNASWNDTGFPDSRVTIGASENPGNLLFPQFPHSERFAHQAMQMTPTPPLVSAQNRASSINTTCLSNPNPANASQFQTTQAPRATGRESSDWQTSTIPSPANSSRRGRSVNVQPIRPLQNTPSSTPRTLPSSTSMPPEVEAREGHSTSLLTPAEYPLSPHDWTSVQSGLHLVRSRSPDRMSSGENGTRYYQFISRFAIIPTPIFPQKGVQKFGFAVSADEFCLRSKPEQNEGTMVHHFEQGSLRYRLRLMKLDQSKKSSDSINWMTSPSIWPAEIYILFNDEPVFPKRGHHFHHDLPIELTDLLQQGLNTIHISLPMETGSVNERSVYYLTVEIIVTMDHASTLDMICQGQKTGAEQTRSEIRRRMQLTASDDIVVQDDSLCISMTDPFSASMFEIPVRGVSCKHIECFDLKTWLQTRRGKKSQSRTEPSLADGWKCPICNGDAAPPTLRVDEFLMEVRQALKRANKHQTRSIAAFLDGSWIANEEPKDDNYDDDKDQVYKNMAKQQPAPRKEPDVIEILDD